MRRHLLIILSFWFVGSTSAQLITVKQDGTGNFIQIQAAIDFSQNGDTILVWPGIYYENLEIYSKKITLASLNLITSDPAYIGQTVIDGDYKESCLKIISNSIVEITGFKITH